MLKETHDGAMHFLESMATPPIPPALQECKMPHTPSDFRAFSYIFRLDPGHRIAVILSSFPRQLDTAEYTFTSGDVVGFGRNVVRGGRDRTHQARTASKSLSPSVIDDRDRVTGGEPRSPVPRDDGQSSCELPLPQPFLKLEHR